MNAVGLVFSNIDDKHVPEITKKRIMATVPFGGRYRLIDFVLSNMTNSGINKIGIIAKRNYQNMIDHIGTGKAWDLARKRGGIRVIQPYGDDSDGVTPIDNRLETLKGIMYYLDKTDEKYVILSDCDVVGNISYADLLHNHIAQNADVSVLYKRSSEYVCWKGMRALLELDENERIVTVKDSSKAKKGDALFLGTIILQKDFLKRHILKAVHYGYKRLSDYCKEFSADITIKGIEFKEYSEYIDSLESYLKCNLDLLKLAVREDLFRKVYRPIYTSVNDSAPSKYGVNAIVENSIIADGCIINGTVKNSVVFRGVKIKSGATVSNSIVMQDSEIGINATLNHIVTDKNVIIGENRMLCGHQTHPFYIDKGAII
ncbi:glucose-1-phosphate adenylyltransferase subunit GlgD [Robertmurraya sp. DFI.2.37]|uniref:glucose-1-phosphate adenylyltransferase subunit GlgD n=1 Tax=Robertmurraya sp. DFI.2.37 TaxID=3031819 RepID=UPI0012444EB1|nr:glucose-1-phosphate adenylyltransferase subunit GlgD [Robertmurraya sp. DFI.2.37]MDF1509104.1 glucose-1-phosphate adenylyltransferase subunit GlgD [Robertmurraya sp. DFI.2.37]